MRRLLITAHTMRIAAHETALLGNTQPLFGRPNQRHSHTLLAVKQLTQNFTLRRCRRSKRGESGMLS